MRTHALCTRVGPAHGQEAGVPRLSAGGAGRAAPGLELSALTSPLLPSAPSSTELPPAPPGTHPPLRPAYLVRLLGIFLWAAVDNPSRSKHLFTATPACVPS